jgi:GNAT superfamily N-acetyltransferase
MCDDWMPPIDLPLTIEEFRALPRNPAYKYEHVGGRAILTPRPKFYRAVRDLSPVAVEEPAELVRLTVAELDSLTDLFAASFRYVQPFGSLADDPRWEAARQALRRTAAGGDGPFVGAASFVARESGQPVGALCVTLVNDGDPRDYDGFAWEQPPPEDCLERRLGQPHVTWVFVVPAKKGRGVGTALLAASVEALRGLGYERLYSTFVLGNDATLLWHWGHGFQLFPHPGSHRLMKRRWADWRAENGERPA